MAEEQINPRNQAAAVADFERKLEALRLLYEHYFLGLEKREPQSEAEHVSRLMRELERAQMQNTGLRYRFRGLVAKLNTYRNYWTRTLREIEKGTYHRDVARVKRRMAREGIELPELAKLRTAADLERALREATVARGKKQAPEPSAPSSGVGAPRAAATGAKAPTALAGIADEQLGDELDRMFEEVVSSPHVVAPPRKPSTFGAPPPAAPRGTPAGGPPPVRPLVGRTPARAAPPPPPHSRRPSAMPPPPPLPTSAPITLASAPPSAAERQRPAPPRPSPAAAPIRPAAATAGGAGLPPGMSKQQMDSIYRRYVKAKQMCGEDPAAVRYESLVKTISSQLPTLRQQHRSQEIDFQVVIRGGKAMLKPKPKEG